MMPSASSWNGFNMLDYAAVIYPGFLNAVGTRPAGCPAAVSKTESGKAGERGGGRARKYAWAQLMMRVLGAVGKFSPGWACPRGLRPSLRPHAVQEVAVRPDGIRSLTCLHICKIMLEYDIK